MEILNHLGKLMEFKSVSEDSECCKAALRYVLELAESFGLKTTLGRYGDVGIVDLGEGPVTVGILAHVDVVNEGNPQLWTVEPYRLTEKDGILYGRGVVDDKGGVIASLYALKKIKESNVPLKKKLRLIIGTAEEIVWTDMEHYKEEFPLPNYGYSPDGSFPIFNRENGYLDVELCFREEVPEGLGGFSGGKARNVIPSNASFEKNGQTVEFVGKAAHSSDPSLGVNAINKLCQAVVGEGKLRFAEMINRYFPEGVYESNLTIFKRDGSASGKGDLTIVPTRLRQEEDRIYVTFNARPCCDIPCGNVMEGLRQLEENYGCSIEVIECLEPMWVDDNQPWINRMQQIMEKHGLDPTCQFAAGCSYAKSMPNFVGWGPVFPEDAGCAHMENERQSLANFLRSLDIYVEYLTLEGTAE